MQAEYYIEGNKYIFETLSFRYVLSEPEIQPISEYEEIHDIKNIMFYYYDVDLFMFDEGLDEEEKDEWKLIRNIATYDFPALLDFKRIIELALADEVYGNMQKSQYNGIVRYQASYSTDSMFNEDAYEIKKIITMGENRKTEIRYDVCFYDGSHDGIYYDDFVGAKIRYITEEDLKVLLKMIDDFVQYSLDKHNQHTVKYNKLTQDSLFTKDNHLYQYVIDRNDNVVIEDKIDEIYIPGDKAALTLKGEQGKHNDKIIIIKEILDGKILDKNGNAYNLEDIRDIFREHPDEDYSLKIDALAKDFLSCMGKEEVKDLGEMSKEDFVHKYYEAMVNRKAMFREEHRLPFPINIKDSDDDREAVMLKNIDIIYEKLSIWRNKQCQ